MDNAPQPSELHPIEVTANDFAGLSAYIADKQQELDRHRSGRRSTASAGLSDALIDDALNAREALRTAGLSPEASEVTLIVELPRQQRYAIAMGRSAIEGEAARQAAKAQPIAMWRTIGRIASLLVTSHGNTGDVIARKPVRGTANKPTQEQGELRPIEVTASDLSGLDAQIAKQRAEAGYNYRMGYEEIRYYNRLASWNATKAKEALRAAGLSRKTPDTKLTVELPPDQQQAIAAGRAILQERLAAKTRQRERGRIHIGKTLFNILVYPLDLAAPTPYMHWNPIQRVNDGRQTLTSNR